MFSLLFLNNPLAGIRFQQADLRFLLELHSHSIVLGRCMKGRSGDEDEDREPLLNMSKSDVDPFYSVRE